MSRFCLSAFLKIMLGYIGNKLHCTTYELDTFQTLNKKSSVIELLVLIYSHLSRNKFIIFDKKQKLKLNLFPP